ncbi:MAG: hypothetical protein E1N59_1492 [Puniceicoccaceae bacterium 5H]|nr:MAG: hypothetical protein E1N59_1492 [Puniceicoccaceae bacterium 5H]
MIIIMALIDQTNDLEWSSGSAPTPDFKTISLLKATPATDISLISLPV